MTGELTPIKISKLIEHWIDHSSSHVESFNIREEQIRQAGFAEAADEIILAVEKMNESIGYLKKAHLRVTHPETI